MLAGCGGDDSGEGDVVRVEATEYAYELPESVAGGLVSMELANAGDEVHEWAFGRLRDGATENDFRQELLRGRFRNLRSIEEVPSVYAMTPGRTLTLTRELEPGRYVVYCSMPAPRHAHFQLGMVRGFEVARSSNAEPPAVDGTIIARERRIDLPRLTAGTHDLRLENAANEPREFKLLSLEPGRKAADLERWFARRFRGEPPADLLGVYGPLEPGEAVYVKLTLEAGRTYHLFDGPSRVVARFEVE